MLVGYPFQIKHHLKIIDVIPETSLEILVRRMHSHRKKKSNILRIFVSPLIKFCVNKTSSIISGT